jgi:hypothetical protein
MPTHSTYPIAPAALILLAGVVIGSAGCGSTRPVAPPPSSTSPAPAPAVAKPEPGATESPVPAASPLTANAKTAPAPAASPAAKPESAVPSVQATVPAAAATPPTTAQAPTPAAEAKLAPLAQAAKPPAPTQAAGPISDPGGEVAVKPANEGPSRVGVAACKMCHKVQFASWSETAHGKRTPPLDCESCHGPGSEYKAIAVMKDPAKAKAAGLVLPAAGFCSTCHKRNWNEGMLKKAHAHKL